MKLPVRLSKRSQSHLEAVGRWWRRHRRAAPDLFEEEWAAVLERLSQAPRSGVTYGRTRVPGVRRLLLPRTRYHVYYVAEEHVILVHAIWHSSRGRGPRLP